MYIRVRACITKITEEKSAMNLRETDGGGMADLQWGSNVNTVFIYKILKIKSIYVII